MSDLPTPTTDTSATNGAPNGALHAPSEPPKEAPKEAAKEPGKEATKEPAKTAPKGGPKDQQKSAPKPEAPKAETAPSPQATPATEAAPQVPPPQPQQVPPPSAPPVTAQPAGMRLRLKIWTDPTSRKRYLMPTAIVSDPRTGMMTAYAMSDEDTKTVKLTPPEWNALPFFYFQEDGPAPRASARPVDVIR